jgi:2-oxoglutarate dehydrogenase E1 component
MNENKFLPVNIDPDLLDELYSQYKSNNKNLDKTWFDFFSGFDFALEGNFGVHSNESLVSEFNVIKLIDAYRKRGHLFTKTNPVRTRRKYSPSLSIENFDFKTGDLDKEFEAGKLLGLGRVKLRTIIEFLEQTYCSNIGSEYMFIRDIEVVDWLKHNIESTRNTPDFSEDKKQQIYTEIAKSVDFEQFIHKRFPGQKRFSIEGHESLIPALNFMVKQAVRCEVEEVDFGMSHRGRLNVLANVLQKPLQSIMLEFTGTNYEEDDFLGDVKYHLGFKNRIKVEDKEIEAFLLPNPSHLEAVDGVTEGFARAHAETLHEYNYKKVLPVLIHGDAAISAQGIVYEVVQMSQLNGYKTGGTIHFVVNNQVGFTTNYLDGRSSTYSTDIAKVIKAPVFHVNSDDPEALVHVVELAVRYRQKFHTDVFIDVLGYRKYGHNEGDEPRFTQPDLYEAISKHPTVKEIYRNQLLESGDINEKFIVETEKLIESRLNESLEKARKQDNVNIYQFPGENYKKQPHKLSVSAKTFVDDVRKIFSLPNPDKFFPKAVKLMESRFEKFNNDNIDWGMAELMAYSSVIRSGKSVRLSGQDSVRGTFSHRHSAILNREGGGMYTPLKHVFPEQPEFAVYNSPLSEYGVLGFEYGYALGNTNSLTIWEAQFGDFNNAAQVIIDQYIASAEDKWGLLNDLVLLLPHGYEGQGPEHSSARIERFLQLAANDNMCIVQPTSPANLFHLLLKQACCNTKPMIVFTPKSLLRHKMIVSKIDEFVNGGFEPLVYNKEIDLSKINTIIFSTGKLYYDLIEKQEDLKIADKLVVNIEQLYPFPISEIRQLISKTNGRIDFIWSQEEPVNMGAWTYIRNEMYEFDIRVIARPASGSPAVGLFHQHKIQQQKIIEKSFLLCECENKEVFCNLKCSKFSRSKDQ